MCGIVGAIAEREVREILLEGLKRLEYRGYDSAGLAFISPTPNALATQINTIKTVGKVNKLVSAVSKSKAKASGRIGIAHTRWATHGKPSVANAHPHLSGADIALVHNGIIENYEALRAELRKAGYTFDTDTDTETIAHLIHANRAGGKVSLLSAVKKTVKRLEGAYGLCVIDNTEPDKLVVARSGSPLVIGVGIGENFVASDPLALGQVTDRFIYLEEGDIAQVERESITIWHKGKKVNRPTTTVAHQTADSDKGRYEHFMLKEIYEQPRVIQDTLDGRVSKSSVLEQAFGINAPALFDKIKTVQIVACGTSSHAGLVAKYWFESIAKLPCQVDIASDYRYRDIIAQPDTLFVTISQSGETADTLAALRYAKKLDYVATLAICNVATSSLVRESDISMLTMAGQEIGVASTKAFTTQLTILLVLAIVLARRTGLTTAQEAKLVKELHKLPGIVEKTLGLRKQIKTIAKQFSDKHHSLFLGRGIQYPVAKEGALKLKEISYIHAEAYPAGELKHGPLALVDSKMPVVAVAPNNDLLGKLKANLSEVSARGGKLFVFADESIGYQSEKGLKVINVPRCSEVLAPIVFTVPLQLLSYYVAITKGTDVDHPRNLAKSVTVE
ncbi:glutamine--fructose-6-phosphate transaminase (isomerizing) [bacterium]|jgi:glutamine---fructose-6-phosphate transaminase (isomerizing)|nr:glutamine--fructose-6-phosphate transaminase (isomerizing) [Gammaproteobacteria bacterium]MDA9766193.1 glutamine--fructose-6-phosphate transaminase (isomerizing) [Gammaproteobacteria bacterium]MDB2483581.1 glutamine--fructose-6-phosphate transaminase (isomerizing) [Gammaproteobacteria bacterium]MDC1501798.1 glutamine--fructose-6-phosphate transaminase (isomerizing) [Gammaproteobacteria bacterium]MDC1532950.1 glutamine--fructose-6-phosphate transaminase (isomerizing) [bacterium]